MSHVRNIARVQEEDLKLVCESRRVFKFSYLNPEVKVYGKTNSCQHEKDLVSPDDLLRHRVLGLLPMFRAWQGEGSGNCIYSLLMGVGFEADNREILPEHQCPKQHCALISVQELVYFQCWI